MFGEPREKKVAAEPLATIALLCAVAGLVATLVASRAAQTVSALLGGGGALLMMLLRRQLDNEALAQGQGMLQVTYDIGYWLSTLFFCAAAVAVLVLRSSGEAPLQDIDTGPQTEFRR